MVELQLKKICFNAFGWRPRAYIKFIQSNGSIKPGACIILYVHHTMTYAIRIVNVCNNNKIGRKWPAQDPRFFSFFFLVVAPSLPSLLFLNNVVCRSRFRLFFFFFSFDSSIFIKVYGVEDCMCIRVVTARTLVIRKKCGEIPETRLILIPFLTVSR